MIIDENQLSSAQNISSTSKLSVHVTPQVKNSQYFEYIHTWNQNNKNNPHNNTSKRLLLNPSSSLSIGQYHGMNQGGDMESNKGCPNMKSRKASYIFFN